VLPLEAGAHTTVDDPWLLAAKAFAPAYIGGWSAAEHWGLTEQLFRSTFVVTAGPMRARTSTLLGAEFRLVRVPAERVASVPSSWRGSARVAVSDRERTLADALAHPEWVGGVRHLAELLVAYRASEHWNPPRLLAALALHPKGAAYKRLGYFTETLLGGEASLVDAARARRSAGVIRLDPSLGATGRIVTRWGLRLNAEVGRGQG
jgi:predicted transcriptional regulator of viral defense system